MLMGRGSARPAFGQEAFASKPSAVDFVFPPLEDPKGESGNVIAEPRILSSRYSGITVQHAKTNRGVKLYVTLQLAECAESGLIQTATAELKRYDRMREVKARHTEDSVEFESYLESTKRELTTQAKLNPDIKDAVCIGRLHERNKRDSWFYDTLAVGFFEGDKIGRVLLYIEGQEYEVILDQELSHNQIDKYHSTGYYGTIKRNRKAPRIGDLPLIKF